jgi:type III pantothenate kinase
MLLAIDVGNTNVTIGVFRGEALEHHWRLASLRERTADELGILITRLFEQAHIDRASLIGIVVASVVPPLTRPIEEMCERYFGRRRCSWMPRTPASRSVHAGGRRGRRPHRERGRGMGGVRRGVEDAAHRGGLRHRHDVRRDLGRARVSGRHHLPRESGSRPTRCSSARRGCRGWTCGSRPASWGRARWRLSSRACSSDTSRWWTASSAASGRRFRMATRAVVIATGGLAGVLADETTSIQHVSPDLTLHGLRLIWDRNQA